MVLRGSALGFTRCCAAADSQGWHAWSCVGLHWVSQGAVLPQNPIAPDSLEALWELLRPLDGVLQEHFAHTHRSSPAADFYYREYFTPLFDLFERHPDGVLRADAPVEGPGLDHDARVRLRGDSLALDSA